MSASKILVPIGFSDQSIVALGQAFNLAKIAFQQRRKKLKKSLSKQGINFDKFTDFGISENQRAEEISPDEYLLIAKSMNNES